MIKCIQLFILLFLLGTNTFAGTVIELQNNKDLTTAITDGQKVRLNTSAAEYVILDSNDHSIKVVDRQKQQVIISRAGESGSGSNLARVRIAFSPQGKGQDVAGFSTRKFSYAANGKHCGFLYGSMAAAEAGGVRELLDAMKVMMDKQRAALGGFASLVDACTLADMQLVDYIDTTGLPMRTEKNGRVELEVKTINTNIALADDTFSIPAYTLVDKSGRVISGQQKLAEAKPATAEQHGQAQNRQHSQRTVQPQPQPRMQTQSRAGNIPQSRPEYRPSAYQQPAYQQRYLRGFNRPY